MKLIKVAGAALNQTPLDWDNNLKNILKAIEIAKSEKTSILCLPELCITGYGCEDMFHSIGFLDKSLELLFDILPHTKNIIVSVGLPLYYKKSIFNVACLIADQKILGFVAKKHLAGDGLHYEPRWFKPWPSKLASEIDIKGNKYPLGDIYFDVSGIKIGFEICEDAWVSRRPGAELSLKGVDIILNPSASHFAFGKHEIRKDFVLEGSRAFGVAYIYSNLLGCEAGRIIYDGDIIIASTGKLLSLGKRLSFDDVIVNSTLLEIDRIRMSQSKLASFNADLKDEVSSVVNHKFEFPIVKLDKELEKSSESLEIEEWEMSENIKKEEFARAITLGLFDYLRKSFSKGFVVSLSGGADSSAVASLIYLMVKRCVHEKDINYLKSKLLHINNIQELNDIKEIVNKILTCVYQPTENSGEVTRNAANKLSEEIGAEYLEFNVNNIVKGYIDIVSQSIGRELNWEKDDLALQNIQARTRGPSVWLLANIKQFLLLTTSNRSEAAVGYATMDGDTCGGLCPIGGIDKNFLREWLKWVEKTGVTDLGTIPSLKYVNDQEPTAELRPKGNKQTDEKDLMPYEVLDAIEKAAIRDKRVPSDVLLLMQGKFSNAYKFEDLKNWVNRFFRLWCINQWKRERYAPSFHVDDENLDPKTWCRFPILSGGFKNELQEMNNLKE